MLIQSIKLKMNDNYNFFINRIALKYYRIENKNHFEKAFYLLNAILETIE